MEKAQYGRDVMGHGGQQALFGSMSPYPANVRIDVRRRSAAPDAFIARVGDLGQNYLRAAHGISAHVPASYLAELWQMPIDVNRETAQLAGRITPANVAQVVDVLFDPVIAWYQQQYYLNRGVGNLIVPRVSDAIRLYTQLPPEVTALYRRDANLMICANVLDDFLAMFIWGEADSFNGLNLNYDAQNWLDLEARFTTLHATITTQLFPLLQIGVS